MAKKETKKPKEIKQKKGKDKKTKGKAANMSQGATANGVPSTGASSVPLANMSPDQMTAAQIEQAIKESNNPESRLKKLRSPVNVRSCLLNILFFIILTMIAVIVVCAIMVDKFSFTTVVTHMFREIGITGFFESMFS